MCFCTAGEREGGERTTAIKLGVKMRFDCVPSKNKKERKKEKDKTKKISGTEWDCVWIHFHTVSF